MTREDDDEAALPDADDLNALLRALDHPEPPASAAELIARARRRGRVAWLRRAAIAVMGLAVAGTVYALPGSPLRAWLERVRPDARSAPVAPAPSETGGSAEAGVAVEPGDSLLIELAGARAGTRLTIALTDDAFVAVTAPQNGARFSSDSNRLVVEVITPDAPLDLRVPRAARHVLVVSGDRVLFDAREGVVREPPAAGPFEIVVTH